MSKDEKKGGQYEQPLSREMGEDELDDVAGGAGAETQPPCEAGSSPGYGGCQKYECICPSVAWRSTPGKT